ncbi:ATP synthase F1, alpha subunit [Ruegeria lacuscaerulensis ITI-1157]|nr:ATP synthase F1, alpha subunit [Ruegeria lacuscaerulensis ITI-1157]SHK12370.1 F-type H+-transporting ATPase subunit alpha [Ruegeria lacuscaerulensis ITI-1157]
MTQTHPVFPVTEPTDSPVDQLVQALQAASPQPVISEIGQVVEVGDGIAVVAGMTHALANELLQFSSGATGIVLDLESDRLGVVLLGGADEISVGEAVRRTRSVLSVPVGSALLGRVVDALGAPLDDGPPVDTDFRLPVETDAPAILDREAVQRPLATGLKVIDAAVPIGLGQRQLIIGDRQTGKTSIAIDTILNQKQRGVFCIYCAVGQRGDAVAKVVGALEDGDAMANSIVISAGDEDPPGLAYVAPFAAMTMARHFSDQGRDVLVVMDDLTHHARAYRELSLLLRRPPGREAYPGDIFYLHARLLERAGNFADAAGGGSITVLPVVETQAENLSAYIPTNLISITDGQVYLSPRQVRKNQFPAVDLGVSVSRVGGKAQSAAFRDVAGNLRVTLSQFEELEDFVRFGTRLDDATRARLARGAAVRRALRQPERDPASALEQIAVILAALEGVYDHLTDQEAFDAIDRLQLLLRRSPQDLPDRIAIDKPLGETERAALLALARQACTAKGRSDAADS